MKLFHKIRKWLSRLLGGAALMVAVDSPGLRVVSKGWFDVECVNPDGSIAWRDRAYNGTTTGGLNHMLGVEFNSVAQITTWYLGLVDNASFSAFALADTMASHAGWLENATYSNGTRPQWTPLSVAAGVITNSSLVAFSINGSCTIKGLFLCSNNTISGTSGTLWATGAFAGGNQVLTNGQTLNVTYNTTLA